MIVKCQFRVQAVSTLLRDAKNRVSHGKDIFHFLLWKRPADKVKKVADAERYEEAERVHRRALAIDLTRDSPLERRQLFLAPLGSPA